MVLRGAGRHAEAVDAFGTLLSQLEESPDQSVRGESFLNVVRQHCVDGCHW